MNNSSLFFSNIEKAKINKRIYYVYLFSFKVLFNYVFTYTLKEKTLCLNILSNCMINVVIFLKYNSVMKMHSLLDIAVIDNISLMKDSGRFVLNYVF